jgi:hypothetical protein
MSCHSAMAKQGTNPKSKKTRQAEAGRGLRSARYGQPEGHLAQGVDDGRDRNPRPTAG